MGEEDSGEVVRRAATAGVTRMLTVGIDLASSRTARALAQGSAAIDFAAGLHPNSAARLEDEWAELRRLCELPECVAVGETGLDYYWDQCPTEQQKIALARHLELAEHLDKPVIIHTRDAFPDIFNELRLFPRVRGVLHCFSGGVVEARQALELGYYLSFAGPLTYPKNDALREAAAFAPEDRILVETDAPFLPPQGKRGKRNEPAFLTQTVARLAEVRGIATERAVELTFENGAALFGRVCA